MAEWLMMNTTETARTLRSRVFNGGDHNPLIIYGGHLLVNVHVPRLSRLWRNKNYHLAMHSELWQFLRWKKILRKLFKRSVFPLMKIKKGMYKCTCALLGFVLCLWEDSFGFILDFFCNKFLYHRVSCCKTNLYFCVLALDVCSHETFW